MKKIQVSQQDIVTVLLKHPLVPVKWAGHPRCEIAELLLEHFDIYRKDREEE
jgi:hypothetical protein